MSTGKLHRGQSPKPKRSPYPKSVTDQHVLLRKRKLRITKYGNYTCTITRVRMAPIVLQIN